MATFGELLTSRLETVAEFMNENIEALNARNVNWNTMGGVPNEWFYRFTYSDKIKACETSIEYVKVEVHNGDGLEFKADVSLIGELESGKRFSITIEGVTAYFRVNTDSDFRKLTEAVISQYKLLERDSDWIYFGIMPNAELVSRAIQRLSDAYWRTERNRSLAEQ